MKIILENFLNGNETIVCKDITSISIGRSINVNHNACLSSTFTMCINDCYGCTTEEIL